MSLESKLLTHLESLQAKGVDIESDPALRSLAAQVKTRLALLAAIGVANHSLAFAAAAMRLSPRRLDHEPFVMAGVRLRSIRKRVEQSRLTDEFCAGIAAELQQILVGITDQDTSPQGN